MNNNSVKDTMYFITDGKGTSMTIGNNVSQITNDNCQDIKLFQRIGDAMKECFLLNRKYNIDNLFHVERR
jgi:hypothetical protein